MIATENNGENSLIYRSEANRLEIAYLGAFGVAHFYNYYHQQKWLRLFILSPGAQYC